LDSDDPAGLCPQCLIQGAFPSALGVDESRTQTIDTGSGSIAEDDFGRYQILRLLGEGGMGTVYLAEQREPIRRPVALKVIKLGMDTSQVLARFANERQALTVMDHPNIARILDAGATGKGRPYFVMEYIEGVPITEYCDRHRMTIGQRLQLFLLVCRAVHHAHQKGVIHRDIKPSNVLVMEQENAAAPKVIDFGISKATDQWALENTLMTQFGQMVGTPEYCSPEQADTVAGEISAATDVYSLGVLLFEMLIGAVPLDSAVLRKSGYAEMLRILREDEVPSLSRKLSVLGEAGAEVAARRQTDLATLRREVAGDLNRIAMKALEKAPERRYGSAAELAADVERYLEHRPVLAAPASRVYRARKFVRRHRAAVFGTAAAMVFVGVSGVTMWSLARRASTPGIQGAEKRPIVLAGFTNMTGDASFEGTLRQTLAGELAKSSYLSVLPDARMTATLRLMVRPADTKFSPEVAAEICERTASAAVVEGSIASLGRQYMLGLRARNCRTGDLLTQEQASAANKEDVFRALDQMANRFQSRAGESVPRVEKETRLPVEVTTPSLEAWRSYRAAMAAHSGNPTEVISLAKRATEIDPGFAMAFALLGRAYDAVGEAEAGAEYIGKAYALRDGVSDPENFFITFNYYRQAPRNLELARQTLETWTRKYPEDLGPHSFFAAFTSSGTGHYDKAVQEGLKVLEIDPNLPMSYLNVAFAYVYLDRASEAEALLRKASERKIESVECSLLRYFLALLRNDQAAMDQESAQRRVKLQAQGWFEHQEALTLAYRGRLKEAAQLSEGAARLARQAGLKERSAQFAGARAAWSALFGMREEGQSSAAEAFSIFRGRDADYGPAFARALLRDSAQAHQIVAELERRYSEDTSVQFSYLPALRALEALNRGHPAKAVAMTQVATPYEFAVPGSAFWAGASFFGALYPVYVRGLAYSRMGRHREAAAEFQKILDHPGIMLNDPMGAVARLQLARAFAASGDHAKATAAYKDLLTIWKGADTDIQLVQDARVESAKLR
jgi:hypothetical protein